MLYLNHRVLFSHRKEQGADACCSVDRGQRPRGLHSYVASGAHKSTELCGRLGVAGSWVL